MYEVSEYKYTWGIKVPQTGTVIARHTALIDGGYWPTKNKAVTAFLMYEVLLAGDLIGGDCLMNITRCRLTFPPPPLDLNAIEFRTSRH